MKNKFNIFFKVDDDNTKMLLVALNSVYKNINKNNIYDINIIYDKLSEENKKLITSFNKTNFNVMLTNLINSEVSVNVLQNKLFGNCLQVFLPNMFPNIDKAVYLSCNTVIKTDIANLYEIDLKNNLIGAVPDEIVNKTYEFIEYTNNFLGVNAQDYFNTDVLVMDFKKLREFDSVNKFFKMQKDVKFELNSSTSYMNLLWQNQVKYLGLEWNKMPIDNCLDEDEIKIVNFSDNYKPYKYKNINYNELFWNSAKEINLTEYFKKLLTSYSDENKIDDALFNRKIKQIALSKAKKTNNITNIF